MGALAFDAAALLVMCVGLFVLTQSPLIAGSAAEEHLGRSRLAHSQRKVREVSRSGR
jgi:hypothetical protein